MKRKLEKLYMAFIIFLLYAPIFTLIVLSFNSSRTRAKWEVSLCSGTRRCLPMKIS